MDIYNYIASSNPYQARSILHKYGYSAKGVKNPNDLGSCLKQLVASEGEDALKDILDSHPDRGILVETYVTNQAKEYSNFSGNTGCGCGCKRCQNDSNFSNFMGVAGDNSVKSVSVYILAASLLLAAAIIVKK